MQSLLSFASLLLPFSAHAQVDTKESLQKMSSDDLQNLNIIVQYRQLKLGNTSNEVTVYDIEKLLEVKQHLLNEIDYSISETSEFQRELLKRLRINKYLELQKGAHETQSMSFNIGN